MTDQQGQFSLVVKKMEDDQHKKHIDQQRPTKITTDQQRTTKNKHTLIYIYC